MRSVNNAQSARSDRDASKLPARAAMAVWAVLVGLSGAVSAQTPTSPCPFTADELTAALGPSFNAGTPEPGILGKGCVYRAKTVSVWVDAGPNPAPTVEMYRKMSNPPGTTWAAVAGDPDKAVHAVAKPDVTPFASLSYERKGVLVNLTVSGVDDKAAVAQWNAKLVKLRRIP